jgi:hypothetical protein
MASPYCSVDLRNSVCFFGIGVKERLQKVFSRVRTRLEMNCFLVSLRSAERSVKAKRFLI